MTMQRTVVRMEKLSKRANTSRNKQTTKRTMTEREREFVDQINKRAQATKTKTKTKTKTNETLSRLEKEEADRRMAELLS